MIGTTVCKICKKIKRGGPQIPACWIKAERVSLDCKIPAAEGEKQLSFVYPVTCKLLIDSIILLYHILEEKGEMSLFCDGKSDGI